MRNEPQKWVETKLLRYVPRCHVSARIRRVPVPFLPGTKSTWGLAEVCWTFSQHSAVSDTPIPRERSDADSKSTPNPADTPSARAYSFRSHHIMIWQATFLMWIMEYTNISLLDSSHPIPGSMSWHCFIYTALSHSDSNTVVTCSLITRQHILSNIQDCFMQLL